jgi:hypothetical protein
MSKKKKDKKDKKEKVDARVIPLNVVMKDIEGEPMKKSSPDVKALNRVARLMSNGMSWEDIAEEMVDVENEEIPDLTLKNVLVTQLDRREVDDRTGKSKLTSSQKLQRGDLQMRLYKAGDEFELTSTENTLLVDLVGKHPNNLIVLQALEILDPAKVRKVLQTEGEDEGDKEVPEAKEDEKPDASCSSCPTD